MTVEETIYLALSTWPALAGLEIRPFVAGPGDTAPYIVYQQIGGQRVKSLAGDSGLANPHFQIDVYAEDLVTAASYKKAVREAMLACEPLGAVHIDEGSGYDTETKLIRARQDFSIWFYD